MMSKKKAATPTEITPIHENGHEDRKGKLKYMGGSQSDSWNKLLECQVLQTLWVKHSDPEEQTLKFKAALGALAGIRPRDELEAMLAAQLLASHHAAMECYRERCLASRPLKGDERG